MLIPKRYADSQEYRYGFQGQEKVDEAKGNGVVYDYGFRIYDARLGKFLSEDPLRANYPFYSPYHFAGNNPIGFVDLDGQEPSRPELFWKKLDKAWEFKTFKKDVEYAVFFRTIGVHNWKDIGLFDLPKQEKMYVQLRYDPKGEADAKYFWWNKNEKKWTIFNPNDIGGTAEEITETSAKLIFGAALIVSGMEFPALGKALIDQLKTQTVLNIGSELADVILSDEKFSFKKSTENVFSATIEGIDVADGVISVAFKGSGPEFAMLKNLLLASIDVTLSDGYISNKDKTDLHIDFAANMFMEIVTKGNNSGSKYHKAITKVYNKILEFASNQTQKEIKKTLKEKE